MLKKGHFWKNFTQQELDLLKEEIFQVYRKKGFPSYELSLDDKIKEFNKLRNYCNGTQIVDSRVIKQSMHGLGLCWSYFPYYTGIKCGKMQTALIAFNDDILFRKVIEKRLRYGTYISDGGILKTLKTFSGVQCVSNFRPSAAFAVYDRYCPENAAVWDMSGGFGGRMLGASVCSKVSKYVFTEPSTKAYSGLVDLAYDIKNYYGADLEIEGWKLGSEDFIPQDKVDVCFSSPPYFDVEKYSDEATQSYIKFSGKEEWLYGFLGQTFKNVKQALKPDGKMIINIKNVKSFPDLEQKTVDMALSLGYSLVETLQLSLSSMIGNKARIGKFKYEPVYVFKLENL